jgi:hypothetical protein
MKALFLMFCLVAATIAHAQDDAAQHLPPR